MHVQNCLGESLSTSSTEEQAYDKDKEVVVVIEIVAVAVGVAAAARAGAYMGFIFVGLLDWLTRVTRAWCNPS